MKMVQTIKNKRTKILFLSVSLLCLVGCKETKDVSSEIEVNSSNSKKQARLEVLLIGSFHFNNFNKANNSDLVKADIIDILDVEYQNELEEISNKIAAFKPDKIFVERPLSYQDKLDDIYKNFNKPYYEMQRNEIWQLGMRTAKKLNHDKLYAFDYRHGIQFPYQQMVETMKAAGQQDRILKDDKRREEMIARSRENVLKKRTLTEMLLEMNETERLKSSIDWYLNYCNTAGALQDTMGVFLTSEWYKRNLYMYSLIQKQVTNKDKRIMVLSGASHTTLQRQFIERNPDWQIIELKDVLKEVR